MRRNAFLLWKYIGFSRGVVAADGKSNMAAGNDDLKGLVFNEEIPESTHFPGGNVTEYGSTEQARPGQLSIGTASAETDQKQDFIIAVFVVSFDTRKGLYIMYAERIIFLYVT
jgi:hypothetical protein